MAWDRRARGPSLNSPPPIAIEELITVFSRTPLRNWCHFRRCTDSSPTTWDNCRWVSLKCIAFIRIAWTRAYLMTSSCWCGADSSKLQPLIFPKYLSCARLSDQLHNISTVWWDTTSQALFVGYPWYSKNKGLFIANHWASLLSWLLNF